ncbi:malonic semialdehyde reductase [Pelomonas sp. KK5]|uniref:malonic semialdehyde reductase n=1 Tax=Pelomonas sp. KK5 TaxID=1855730 RepID=UPI00097C533F|nr:malonic semialdehyde reductase [Pelomonas sp. KK5]
MLSEHHWDLLLRQARSFNGWLPRPVEPALLRELYELAKMGPTSMNCSPARFIFVTSAAARERLLPLLAAGNVEKTRTAPVTVIVGAARNFQQRMPQLFPQRPTARSIFDGNDALRESTAFRNSSLQGAYLMLAARGLGLDCGPMSGFDAAAVEAEFLAGEDVAVNFLCNLGHGDPGSLFERLPRLAFDEACRVL